MGFAGLALGKGVLLMWNYEKRLQFPVNITQTNPKIAQIIITQYGGPDGELSASMRYLAQRYTMPYNAVTGVLTDIGVSVPKLRITGFKCTPEGKPLRSFKLSQ